MISSNISIQRTDSKNEYFIALVTELDAELAAGYSEYDTFYAQYNKIEHINHVVVAVENNIPVGCGAMKKFDDQTMEIKRMYTRDDYRGKGIASAILLSLESWAKELSFERCVLETGSRQLSALALYKRKGYQSIPNYGQYIGVADSFCFEKAL